MRSSAISVSGPSTAIAPSVAAGIARIVDQVYQNLLELAGIADHAWKMPRQFQRQADACHAGSPAEPVEELAEQVALVFRNDLHDFELERFLRGDRRAFFHGRAGPLDVPFSPGRDRLGRQPPSQCSASTFAGGTTFR